MKLFYTDFMLFGEVDERDKDRNEDIDGNRDKDRDMIYAVRLSEAIALLHVVPFYLGFYVAGGTRSGVFPNEHSYIPLDQYLSEESPCKNLLSLVTRKKTRIQTPTTLSPSSYFFGEMGMDQNLVPPQI